MHFEFKPRWLCEVIAKISSLPTQTVKSIYDFEIFLKNPDSVPQDDPQDSDPEDPMKIVPTKAYGVKATPLLPLIDDDDEHKLTKENSVKYLLRSNPASDENKYTMLFRILEGTESVRQVLKWRHDAGKLCPGMNVGDCPNALPLLETIMTPLTYGMFLTAMNGTDTRGATLRYNAALAAAVGDAAKQRVIDAGLMPHYHFVEIHDALNSVVRNVLPNKVLARVKRSLRRDMRKPANMKIRFYYNALKKIVNTEIPKLPPFAANQTLTDDELMDILLYGCPNSWTKDLEKLGVDPYEHSTADIIGYLENVETAEAMDTDPKTETVSNKKKSPAKSNNKSKNGEFYCLLHGKNGTHDTDDCTKLKAEAKKLKTNTTKSGGKNANSNNKSNWKKKADDASNKAKSEITSIVKKSVKAALKDLKVADKKRKSSRKESDGDMNVIDNMDAFNYATSKLDINDDSSSTESEVSA